MEPKNTPELALKVNSFQKVSFVYHFIKEFERNFYMTIFQFFYSIRIIITCTIFKLKIIHKIFLNFPSWKALKISREITEELEWHTPILKLQVCMATALTQNYLKVMLKKEKNMARLVFKLTTIYFADNIFTISP